MKTVFTNSQCAHVWAAQKQESGRTPKHSMSFEGPTIFSYRTAIARIHDLADTTKLVLMNSERYSMTTSSKHMPDVRRAVNHLQSLYVPVVDPASPYAMRNGHEINMGYLREEYQKQLARLPRMRDCREYDYQRLEELASNARRYAIAFNLPAVYPDGYVANDCHNTRVFRSEREARLNTPKAIAARERAKEKRDAQRTAKQEADRLEREERSRIWKEEAEARRLEDMRTLPERIELWRRGAANGYGNLHGLPPMLRVSTRGNTIQTSHGAEIPLDHGTRALRFIRIVWAKAQTYSFDKAQGNPAAVHVGHFTIDAITATHVRAGCHNFERAEIEQFMITTGVLDDEKTSAEQSAIG